MQARIIRKRVVQERQTVVTEKTVTEYEGRELALESQDNSPEQLAPARRTRQLTAHQRTYRDKYIEQLEMKLNEEIRIPRLLQRAEGILNVIDHLADEYRAKRGIQALFQKRKKSRILEKIAHRKFAVSRLLDEAEVRGLNSLQDEGLRRRALAVRQRLHDTDDVDLGA